MLSCRQELCVQGQRWHQVRQTDLGPRASSLPGPGLSQGQGNDQGTGFFLGVTCLHFSSRFPLSFLLVLHHLPFLVPSFASLSYDFLFLPSASLPLFLSSSLPLFPPVCCAHFSFILPFSSLGGLWLRNYITIMRNNFCFLEETHK